MQLGTRWSVGGEVPPRVPEAMVAAIREVEAELDAVDTGSWRWTLTWLESRPGGAGGVGRGWATSQFIRL